jgi:hypothetical protein
MFLSVKDYKKGFGVAIGDWRGLPSPEAQQVTEGNS